MDEFCPKAAAFRWGTLLYYNRVLRERKIITEQEYRQMQRNIQQRYGRRPGAKP